MSGKTYYYGVLFNDHPRSPYVKPPLFLFRSLGEAKIKAGYKKESMFGQVLEVDLEIYSQKYNVVLPD